jgi:enoyl-CoA hydratase
VTPEALEATLAEIAATIAKAPPSALRLAKRCIEEGLDRDPRGALATELLAIEENLTTAEWRTAMAGFKR